MDLSTSGLTTLAWEGHKPHLSEVFSRLHIDRHRSKGAVNTEYRRLSKLRYPDKVRPEAKAAATDDFKYLNKCYC